MTFGFVHDGSRPTGFEYIIEITVPVQRVNQRHFARLQIGDIPFVDFMYSKEDIDRKGIITNIVGRPGGHNAFDAGYLSVVAKCNYRFLPKWNAFVKGMYETASVTKASEGIEKGNYSTSWGYLAGIEFYPMETNLHFFVTYVGRSYDFTSRAKVLGQENYSTNRVSVGFIWQMPVF